MDTRLFNALNTGIILLDATHRALWVNESARRITSMGLRQLASVPFESWVTESQVDELSQSLTHLVNELYGFTYRELVLVRDGHQVTADASFSYLDPPIGDAIILVELAEVDQLLKISRDSRKVSDEEGFRKLVQGLAHEIKNPLGGIKGAAQLLAKEAGANGYADYLDVIVSEADRLKSLVDRLLGSPARLEHEPVNMHQLLERTRALLLAESNEQVSIIRDYDPSLPEIMGDRGQIQQAILNIAKNALEALTESATANPEIRFQTRAVRRSVAGSLGRQNRTLLQIRIEDNGPGIPSELTDRLFFPMVSGRAQGSGIGLSISQTIIHRHHGWIEVSSRPGQTQFDLIVPFGES
ncbi:MAG: PAS domain-containing sensor histidine kinase [Gammaproteobacteria bacterium]|nr:PAS domain-containing sensor histidine kinase [Gammaproteobacteria bacterium]